MTDKKGYRKCVRVIITKGSQILLGQKVLEDKRKVYAFPGGGVEDGDTLEETVIKECLEEVGIEIKNIKSLNLIHRHDVKDGFFTGERAKLFKGLDNNWYIAEFMKTNKKHFGIEGDDMPFIWVSPDKAITMINNGHNNDFNHGRIEAINKLKQVQSNNVSLENW